MGIFRRRGGRPAPAPLPLALPRLDGAGWPEQTAGRPSFEASTYCELGSRRAYEPLAHELADRLVPTLLPRLDTGACAQDAPYLAKVFLTAARLGVGIGLVERESLRGKPDEVDAAVVAALGQARRGLPSMREDWARAATWFLLAGHYLARQDAHRHDDVVRALAEQVDDGW